MSNGGITTPATLPILIGALAKLLDSFAGATSIKVERVRYRSDGRDLEIYVDTEDDDALRAIAKAFNLKVTIVEYTSERYGATWWLSAEGKHPIRAGGKHHTGIPPVVMREAIANAAEDLSAAIGGGS